MPAVLAGTFCFSIVGIVVSFLRIIKSNMTGYFAGLFIIGAPFFITHAATQSADVPLAYFFLATYVTIFLADVREGEKC